MHRLRLMLLVMVFALQSLQGAVASVKTCCEGNECSVVQCAVMKCLADQSPVFLSQMVPIAQPGMAQAMAEPPSFHIPLVVVEVWHPPD